jgi:aryl-alcohol dehydrogenase-like predicted oxidoreductase
MKDRRLGRTGLNVPDATAPVVGATSPTQLSESLQGASVQLDGTTPERLDAMTQDFISADAALK